MVLPLAGVCLPFICATVNPESEQTVRGKTVDCLFTYLEKDAEARLLRKIEKFERDQVQAKSLDKMT
jgi:hypothetical protein